MLVSALAASTRTLRARSSGMEIVMFFMTRTYENTKSVSKAVFLHPVFPGDAYGTKVHRENQQQAVDENAQSGWLGIGEIEETHGHKEQDQQGGSEDGAAELAASPPWIRAWGGTSPISPHSLLPILNCLPQPAGCSPKMPVKSSPPSFTTLGKNGYERIISSALRDRLAAEGEALATAGLLSLLNLRSGATGQELLNSLEASVPALLDSL